MEFSANQNREFYTYCLANLVLIERCGGSFNLVYWGGGGYFLLAEYSELYHNLNQIDILLPVASCDDKQKRLTEKT